MSLSLFRCSGVFVKRCVYMEPEDGMRVTEWLLEARARARVCVCVCVRACVRACVRMCVCVCDHVSETDVQTTTFCD